MSYICLMANENGVAAAADSRLTVSPKWLHIHVDKARKVFSDEQQGLIWACCGITFFGGVNYFRVVERILRTDCRSMGAKLGRIAATMERVTRLNHLISRGKSVFTLILAEPKRGTVTVLDVVNGRTSRKTLTGPVAVEGGFGPGEKLPSQDAVAQMPLEQMTKTVRDRTMTAVKRAAELSKADKKQIQTVGGNVHVVYLPAERAE